MQINILFLAFRLLFSFWFSHYLYLTFFCFFTCSRHLYWKHQLMRRDLNPQTLRLTAERATYLRHTSIFLYEQKPSPVNHIQPQPYAKWSIRESNPPPPACKTGVAPLRLMPRIRRQPSCRHI